MPAPCRARHACGRHCGDGCSGRERSSWPLPLSWQHFGCARSRCSAPAMAAAAPFEQPPASQKPKQRSRSMRSTAFGQKNTCSDRTLHGNARSRLHHARSQLQRRTTRPEVGNNERRRRRSPSPKKARPRKTTRPPPRKPRTKPRPKPRKKRKKPRPKPRKRKKRLH